MSNGDRGIYLLKHLVGGVVPPMYVWPANIPCRELAIQSKESHRKYLAFVIEVIDWELEYTLNCCSIRANYPQGR